MAAAAVRLADRDHADGGAAPSYSAVNTKYAPTPLRRQDDVTVRYSSESDTSSSEDEELGYEYRDASGKRAGLGFFLSGLYFLRLSFS